MGNKTVGQRGEDRAAQFLVERGFRVVERNYRCRYGEADIVVQSRRGIGLIEVKARGSDAFGLPAEAIGQTKVRRMQRIGECWRQERNASTMVWLGVVTILGNGSPELITEIEAVD